MIIDNAPGNKLKHCASCPSLNYSIGLIRARAFDKQVANVVILENDPFYKQQIHETLTFKLQGMLKLTPLSLSNN